MAGQLFQIVAFAAAGIDDDLIAAQPVRATQKLQVFDDAVADGVRDRAEESSIEERNPKARIKGKAIIRVH